MPRRNPGTNRVDDRIWEAAVRNLITQFELVDSDNHKPIEKFKSYQNQYLNNHLINPADFLPGFYNIDKSAIAKQNPDLYRTRVHVSHMIWEGTRFYFLYYHVYRDKDQKLKGKVKKTFFIDATSFIPLCTQPYPNRS